MQNKAFSQLTLIKSLEISLEAATGRVLYKKVLDKNLSNFTGK